MDWSISCPWCQASNEDPFEVMPRGSVDWSTCVRCRNRFFLLVTDCHKCEQENMFAWRQVPLPAQMSGLACVACGWSVGRSDETPSTDDLGRW